MISDAIVLTICFAIICYCVFTLNKMTKATNEFARAAMVCLTLGVVAKFFLTLAITFPFLLFSEISSYQYLDKIFVTGIALFLLLNRRNPKC